MSLRWQALALPLLCTSIGSTAFLTSCGSASTPEILRGVSAEGGYFSACPRDKDDQRLPLALSPEFNARLADRFPPGSSEKALIGKLTAEGFKLTGSCKEDPTIKILAFDANGTFGPGVIAQVYWQVDLTGRVTWTKGFVGYTFF